MRKIVAAIFALFIISGNFAQTNINLGMYSALTIPDSLKKGADAVVRLDESTLEVSSPSRYTLTTREVITLLNKEADHHLYQYHHFDKFHKIDDIEIKLYNALGLEIRKFKKKDFEIAAYDDGSLHTDNKIMKLYIPVSEYPCTIEASITMQMSGYISFSPSMVQSPNHAVERYSYTVKVPPQLDIHYKTGFIDLKPTINKTPTLITYHWQTKNLKAIREEKYSWASYQNYPYIRTAPSQFEFDGSKGNSNSWKEFGAWAYPLYEDPAPFSYQKMEEIKKMIASVTDKREQISILYKYLQQNFRYVSIQLGIGGFKPFAVSFVDEKKYGDCKALTNYMRYMLKVADIPSYPALINANYNSPPVDPAFPANGFNHVILCIPLHKDTVWLECTSKETAFGELSTFTENKNALLITPQGGVLVPTPKSRSNQNKLSTLTEIKVNKEGVAELSATINSTGAFSINLKRIEEQEKEAIKRSIVQSLNYKTPDDFSFAAISPAPRGSQYQLKLIYDQVYDFKAGNKFFYRQRMYNINDMEFKPNEARTRDIVLEYPFEKRDTTIYHLPAGFKADALPPAMNLETPFSSYRKEVKQDESGNTITIITELILKNHIIPAKDHDALAIFFQQLNKADGAKLVIIGE